MNNIHNCKILKKTTQDFTFITEELQYKYSRNINITKCSKIWLNKECDKNLAKYQVSRGKTNWIKYKKSVRTAKRIFFDNRIQEIVSTNKRP